MDSAHPHTGLEGILSRFSAEMVSKTNSEMVSRSVVASIKDILRIDSVGMFLAENETMYTSGKGIKGVRHKEITPPQLNNLAIEAMKSRTLQYLFGAKNKDSYFKLGGSAVSAPIMLSDEVIGALIAESSEENFFSQDALIALKVAAHIAGLTIEKTRFLTRERQRSNERAGLRSMMNEVISELDLPVLLQSIVDRAAILLDATGGELGLFHDDDKELEIVVSTQLRGNHIGARQQLGEGVMGTVAQTRKPLIVDDYREWEGRMEDYGEIRATIGVPLIADEKLLGVFTTISTLDNKNFGHDDLELLKLFAQQAVIAIENAKLYDRAQAEIREKESIQQEISRQKEYYEALLVNSPVAIVAADISNIVISWNPMAEKLFGYSQEEVIGNDVDLFVANNQIYKEEAKEMSTQVLDGDMVQVTTKRTRKDGSFIDIELLALPVMVQGERVGFVAIYHDLTEIKRIEEALRKQNTQMQSELELAGDIQKSFLLIDMPRITGWDFGNALISAKETSGDFYDVRILPNGNLGIFLGDVVDKGVGAALFMSLCLALLRSLSSEQLSRPNKVLQAINKEILQATRSGQFLTAFFAILDTKTGSMSYSNAGHPPSLLYSAKTQGVSRQIRTGMPLGISKAANWSQGTFDMTGGDFLCLYTDGITEGFNGAQVPYGEERLKAILEKFSGKDATEITKAAVADLKKFVGTSGLADDIAIITIKKTIA